MSTPTSGLYTPASGPYYASQLINLINNNSGSKGSTQTSLAGAATNSNLSADQQKAAQVFNANFAAANTDGNDILDAKEMQVYAAAHTDQFVGTNLLLTDPPPSTGTGFSPTP
jgi:hypothetical protein